MRYLLSFYNSLLHACVQLHRCLYGDMLSVCIFHVSLSLSLSLSLSGLMYGFLIILDIIARSFCCGFLLSGLCMLLLLLRLGYS